MAFCLSELTEGPTISQQERSALVERLLKNDIWNIWPTIANQVMLIRDE